MGFNGTCFAAHSQSMRVTPTHVDNISLFEVSGATFNDLYVGTDPEVLTQIPDTWSWTTSMYAKFDGTLTAGNLDYMIEQISAVRVKRRIKGTNNWITLWEVPVSKAEDLQFYEYDDYVQWGQTYEYALVPVVDQIEALTNTLDVTTLFSGMYITDGETAYYTYAEPQIGTYQRNAGGIPVETMAGKYPYYVKNSAVDYDSGSAEGIFYPLAADNCTISTDKLFDYRQAFMRFLTNGRAKILKDCYGQIWMVHITGSPTNTRDGHPMVTKTSFEWSEIGDVNSQRDLYDYGFVDVAPHIHGG